MSRIGKWAPLQRWAVVAIFAVSGLVSRPTLADSKQSVTHTMQWEDSDFKHRLGTGLTVTHERSGKIAVEIFSARRVLVIDSGISSAAMAENFQSNEDQETWANVWQGTWTWTGDVMRLDLTLASRQCTRQKKRNKTVEETPPCNAISKQLALLCTSSQVTTEGELNGKQIDVPAPAWTCTQAAPVDVAGTPSTWILGKEDCVKVLYVQRQTSYQKCEAVKPAERPSPQRSAKPPVSAH